MATALTERPRLAAPVRTRRPRRAWEVLAAHPDALTTLAVAGLLCFATFHAKGGLKLESMTTVEIVLTLVAGAIAAGAAVAWRATSRVHGVWSVGLLAALAVVTGLSVVWSVAPDASWQDASRMLAYTACFGAAVTLARIAPGRWAGVLGGVTLAAVVVCAYALLTKVFPGSLAPSNTYARLEEPFGYWNAVGLMAAMGAVGCMWLGARRTGHALLSALAYPAMGLLLLVLALAYSRGALVALVLAAALWLCVVPLRLRGAAVLIAGALGAGAIAAYAFSTHALSAEGVELAQRTTAGHRLGALAAVMLVVLAIVGVAIGFRTAGHPPSRLARRRAGALLVGLLLAGGVAFAGALAHSHRGLTGSISHAVSSLTDPNAKTPPNTPGRLTAVASVRARYWKEALEVFDAHPVTGAGAMGYQTARLRYRKAPLVVAHAHGFIVQTLADLGLVGLALALALLACWAAAAGRATHPFNRSWTSWRTWRERETRPGWRALGAVAYSPERVALLTMLCIVACFGAHSLIDWTWYVPGVAVLALICAGWLAGRGPLPGYPGAGEAAPRARLLVPRSIAEIGYPRLGLAAVALAAALLAAWSQWQPQRSEDARQQALERLGHDRSGALAAAREAVSRDPLSPLAAITLAEIEQATGLPARARADLQKLVREQPSNPQTWLALGRYDLAHDPRMALAAMNAAIYLNPESIAPELLSPQRADREAIEIYNEYIQALRASRTVSTAPSTGGTASTGPAIPRVRAVRHAGRARTARPRASGSATSRRRIAIPTIPRGRVPGAPRSAPAGSLKAGQIAKEAFQRASR